MTDAKTLLPLYHEAARLYRNVLSHPNSSDIHIRRARKAWTSIQASYTRIKKASQKP